ncbi:MAG: UDP-N-acetylmuramoyl-L-alanyl-D-glutamate--2,6-diaminopimelate ligase [Tissierellia bacterium]|nr:UDP-N-acetylmuramoyl-L-alanyl-D-glutamate--2,6-diaminopimelate ligase [Tissierellia bacterium]MDD4725570.1 UDP-N-acetylmuramoyl-L-alanyl-D-glutamate--2,6-diaminopimelate ligase [Tissierellia bacterium]
MKLSKLLESYKTIKTIGNLDININGISQDSRKIKDNYLFMAKEGFNKDGHKLIDDAIANGANCILLEKNASIKPEVTYIWVEDVVDAIAYLSSKFYNEPSKNLDIIGVTGTNGKTSTTYLIKSILDVNNIYTGLMGTMGININDEKTDTINTTPDPIVINSSMDKMVKSNLNACVMEVSSHALDFKRVEYIDFSVGVFTNLSKDHLDYHKTMENYFKSKLKLFYKTSKCNIINIDDKSGKEILKHIGNRIDIITYGIENKADVYATEIEYSIDKVKFVLNYGTNKEEISLNLPGKFNIYNALAAASCGIAYNLNLKQIKTGLEKLEHVKGRVEVVETNKDFSVIIDFAHTPDGLENVLNSIKQFSEGRIIVVFGAGGNRDKTKRPEMGRIVGTYSDYAIVTSDNPRYENPEKIIEEIKIGVKETKAECRTIVDRKEAIEYALSIAKAKDIILLAGKGHETYTIIKDKTYPCNEREIVLNYLKK